MSTQPFVVYTGGWCSYLLLPLSPVAGVIEKRLLSHMTFAVFCTLYFYYIACVNQYCQVLLSLYISLNYLFIVALNAGYLKRFYGL